MRAYFHRHLNIPISVLFTVLTFFLWACESIDVDAEKNDAVPFAVDNFVDQFFHGRGLSKSTDLGNDEYTITVKDGPTMTLKVISDSYINPYVSLLSYTGHGETMPPYLAQDQLPEKLYNYIDGLEMTTEIHDMARSNGKITVNLTNATVEYDTVTGTITES